MADNVFKFRRLKWGDPERKLQMLPEDAARTNLPWIEISLSAFIAAALIVIAWHLF